MHSETPHTPRVVVEDFRHRSDEGYSRFPSAEVGGQSQEETDDEEEMDEVASIAVVDEQPVLKPLDVDDIDVLEDGRPSFRLPERQSSRASSAGGFPWCFSFNGGSCFHWSRGSGRQPMRNKSDESRKIIIREMDTGRFRAQMN